MVPSFLLVSELMLHVLVVDRAGHYLLFSKTAVENTQAAKVYTFEAAGILAIIVYR